MITEIGSAELSGRRKKNDHGVISSRWRKEKGMATKLSSTKSPGSKVAKDKAFED